MVRRSHRRLYQGWPLTGINASDWLAGSAIFSPFLWVSAGSLCRNRLSGSYSHTQLYTTLSLHAPTHSNTHSHLSLSLTCIDRDSCQMSLLADRLVRKPEDQTYWGMDPEREVLQVKQILWLNCSFSIAFVQYQVKKQIEKFNFYFISQSSHRRHLYRSYRVNMALRHLMVGLPNSLCK